VALNDGRLRAERRFQIIRIDDKKTLLRARSYYICTNLSNGKPARMPNIFKTCFAMLPSVSAFLREHEGQKRV
jgi:acyl-CoA thioester hydrolase